MVCGVAVVVAVRMRSLSQATFLLKAQARPSSPSPPAQKTRLLAITLPQRWLQEVHGITAVAVCCHRRDGCSGGIGHHGACANQAGQAMVG